MKHFEKDSGSRPRTSVLPVKPRMEAVVTDREIGIAVVGAGPAGLMAAMVAARAGVSVRQFERSGWTGGRLGLQVQPLQGPRSIYRGLNGMDFCRRLLDEAVAAGVEVTLDAEVCRVRYVASEPATFRLVYSRSRGRRTSLQARAIVLATGSWEPWSRFAGSGLPGVMRSGDAQVMVNLRRELPGGRVLVVGSDDAGLLVASNLVGSGAEVVAVLDDGPSILGREFSLAGGRRRHHHLFQGRCGQWGETG